MLDDHRIKQSCLRMIDVYSSSGSLMAEGTSRYDALVASILVMAACFRYSESLVIRKTVAAINAPKSSESQYTHRYCIGPFDTAALMMVGPNATAGLNAPPEMDPTENAAAATVNPMANPKKEFELWMNQMNILVIIPVIELWHN